MKIVYVLPKELFDENSSKKSLKHILYHFNKKNELFPIVPFNKNVKSFETETVAQIQDAVIESNFILEENLTYLTIKKSNEDWNIENSEEIKSFCEAVSQYINGKVKPDIVHIFGSEYGYLIKLLDKRIKTIFNIDNISQDSKAINSLNDFGKSENYTSLLYGAIYADLVIFPSKKIILQIEKGEIKSELKDIILKRYENVFGMLEGIDYKIWNPKHDRFVLHNFSSKEIFNKNLCKSKLQNYLNLTVDNSVPLLIYGDEISPKFGFDIIKSQLNYLSKMKIQLLIFGKPEKKYWGLLNELSDKFENIRFINKPEEKILHQIISSSDIFISTSSVNCDNYFHLKAMRYGVIPFTYNTGIYADTIITKINNPKKANGFLYLNKDSASFISRLKEVIDVFQDKELWYPYIENAMTRDFSWKEILKEYEDLYFRKRK